MLLFVDNANANISQLTIFSIILVRR